LREGVQMVLWQGIAGIAVIRRRCAAPYAPVGWFIGRGRVGPQPRPESLQLRVEGADQCDVTRACELGLGLGLVVVLEHVAGFCCGREALGAELVEGEGPVGDRLAVGLSERGCELLAGQVLAGDANGPADGLIAALEVASL
jgi:hypothetical protein